MTDLYFVVGGVLLLAGSIFGFYKMGQAVGKAETKREYEKLDAKSAQEVVDAVSEPRDGRASDDFDDLMRDG